MHFLFLLPRLCWSFTGASQCSKLRQSLWPGKLHVQFICSSFAIHCNLNTGHTEGKPLMWPVHCTYCLVDEKRAVLEGMIRSLCVWAYFVFPHPALLVIMWMPASTLTILFSSQSGSWPEVMSRISAMRTASFCNRELLNNKWCTCSISRGTSEVLRNCFVFESLDSESAGKATQLQVTTYKVGQLNAKVKAHVHCIPTSEGKECQPASAESPTPHVWLVFCGERHPVPVRGHRQAAGKCPYRHEHAAGGAGACLGEINGCVCVFTFSGIPLTLPCWDLGVALPWKGLGQQCCSSCTAPTWLAAGPPLSLQLHARIWGSVPGPSFVQPLPLATTRLNLACGPSQALGVALQGVAFRAALITWCSFSYQHT